MVQANALLAGHVQTGGILTGKIQVRASPTGSVHISTGEAAVPKYDGETTVTPKVADEIILPTRDKIVKDDITVLKIPQFEVSNESGGYTLIIGEEYYDYGD